MSETTELTLDPEPAPRAPRSGGRLAAALVAVVAVVGGSVFAVNALSGDENNPEDPVRAMFEAAEKSDVIGVLEQLVPGEREALQGPLTELVDELNRLEILDDADLGGIAGVQLRFDDLELDATEVTDDVAGVRITGGKASYDVDLAKLPLGDFILDIIGHPLEGTESDADPMVSEDDDDVITTVKRDGRWYVSIGYSVAEMARRSAGMSPGQLGPGIDARGASSPEAAIEAMFDALTDVDLRRLIALLPPDELGAVQDYAGLFGSALDEGAEQLRSQFSFGVEGLELDSERDGDQAVVKVRDATVRGNFGGLAFSYADGCATIQPPVETGEPEQRICQGDDPARVMSIFGGGFLFGGIDAETLEPPTLSFGKQQPDVGFVVTEVDGEWYVSPTRTLLGGLVETLRLFQRRDLDALRAYFEGIFTSARQAQEERFAEYSDSIQLEEHEAFEEGGFERYPTTSTTYESNDEPTESTAVERPATQGPASEEPTTTTAYEPPRY